MSMQSINAVFFSGGRVYNMRTIAVLIIRNGLLTGPLFVTERKNSIALIQWLI